MSDISNPSGTSLPPSATTQVSGQIAPLKGNYRGEHVGLVPDPVAMLEDAAEELTFAHSEKVEKKLAKRKMGKSRLKSFAMEQAERYLRQVPDLEKNKKLADFAKQISQLSATTTQQQLREYAKQSYQDVSHQFLALSYARDLLQEEGTDPARIANLNEAIKQLEKQEGAAIRAGINVSRNANDAAAQGGGSVQRLRDLYRDVVIDYKSITQAYEQVAKKHDGKKFMDAIDFLLGGLAAEISKDNRSLPKSRLKAIMDDIYQLKLLGGMYHQCTMLMKKVHENYQSALAHGGQALLQAILVLKEKRWYSDQLVEHIADDLEITPVQARIYFFNGLKDLVRLIPPKAFADENRRAELMESVQQVLDATIDKEIEE